MKKIYAALAAMMCLIVLMFAVGCSADLSKEEVPSEFADGLAEQDADLADGADLRIMSFNALVHMESWGGTPVKPRAVKAIAMLEKYSPDVVGLQECCSDWNKYLNANLEGYAMIRGKINAFKYNYSPIIYNTATLELIKEGHILYDERGNDNCRAVTWGVFKRKADGKVFAVTNTHLDLIREDDYNKWFNMMSSQADELMETLDTLRKDNDCVIFSCGDYNAMDVREGYAGLSSKGSDLGRATASEIYRKIVEERYEGDGSFASLGISDVKYADGIAKRCGREEFFKNEDGTDDLSRPKEGHFLAPTWDHIFMSNNKSSEIRGFTILSEGIYEGMSDHYPIFADIML